MISSSPGKIITFYSYKGGTGRSMALANVAWILASNGKRVLVLDWDLEAPGLHAYFYPFLVDKELTDSDGVIDFVFDFAVEAMTLPKADAEAPQDWYQPHANILRYAAALNWDFGNGGVLDFVPAGRQGPSYSVRVNSFNWQDFYDNLGGGVFLEAAKEKMREAYDYTLIDSRTGVSDTSGICTVQMPDILVVCFTLNNQSIEGAAAVLTSVYEQRQKSGLQVFPVPMRIENAEQEKLDLRWEYAKHKFALFPAHMSLGRREQYWGEVAAPYIPYYAYEEILAIFGERHRRTNSLLASMEKLTAYLIQGSVKQVHVEESIRQEILAQYEGKALSRSIEGDSHIAQATEGGTAIVASYEYAPPRPDDDPHTIETARRRLAELPLEEVLESSPLPHGSRMPLIQNPLFVGREDKLKELAKSLKTTGGRPATVAVTGIGGVGKSQLASEFVHRYGHYFLGGVFWLSFADAAAVAGEVASCGGAGAMELRPDFHAIPLEDQVREVMSAWQSPLPRLLVFDNCENQKLLKQWRPPTGGCRVLLTSRRERWEPTLGVVPLPVDVLSRQQSIELLGKYRSFTSEEESDLEAIARELGDLPLALHLAGSYLASDPFDLDPAEYLRELRHTQNLQHESLLEGGDSPTEHVQNISRTFWLSYERLETSDPTDELAVKLLARAAHFAPGELIPRELLLSTLNLEEDDSREVQRARGAFSRLLELGLLESEEKRALRMNRLVTAFVRAVVADEEAQSAVEESLLNTVGRLLEEGYPAPLLDLLAHLRAGTEAAQGREDQQAALLCNQLGRCLQLVGAYQEARPYYERALAITEKVLGAEHPYTASSLNNLAGLYAEQGRYEEAELLYERALEIWERVLGSEHPETAASLNNLALLLRDQGEYEEARSLLERALAISEKVLGPEHPYTAASLDNLGRSTMQRILSTSRE